MIRMNGSVAGGCMMVFGQEYTYIAMTQIISFGKANFLLVRGGFSQKVAITMIWWGVYICSNAGGGVVDS